jgi:nucleoid-associated protein YgaU
MTADAKVGLLLGLVFIVLIAFLINGLPGFLNPPSKLANVMPQDPKPNVVINQQAEKAVDAMSPHPAVRVSETPKENRADVTLKGDKPEIQEPAPEPKPADPQPKDSAVSTDKPVESKPVEPKPVKPVADARTYVVQPGDNLSKIAVAMYGSEQGNKLAAVQAIYEANKDQMKTASDILPGKKLVIPNLAPPADTIAAADSIPAKTADKPSDKATTKTADKPAAKPAGKSAKPKPANPDPGSFEQPKKKPVSQKEAGKTYRVKSGESLWTIAEKQLGDGNRYREIISLNAQVLRKPDDVRNQMDLKLPKR